MIAQAVVSSSRGFHASSDGSVVPFQERRGVRVKCGLGLPKDTLANWARARKTIYADTADAVDVKWLQRHRSGRFRQQLQAQACPYVRCRVQLETARAPIRAAIDA